MMSLIDKAEDFIKTANLAVVFDHARAGNMFFITLFDQHEEVLCSPAMQYMYSYIVSEFGEMNEVDSKIAYDFATKISYFKHVCEPLNDENIRFFQRHGFSEEIRLDREKIRSTFELLVLKESTITRKRLIVAMYASYAVGTNRNLRKIKYILTSDAISLKTETIFQPFSAQVVELMLNDFSTPKFFHLIRDPRASFASYNHEYTNDNGNTYGLSLKNYLIQIKKLFAFDLSDRKGCVFFTTFAYFTSGSKTMSRLKNTYNNLFLTIKNEELNLNFKATISAVTTWLGVSNNEMWFDKDYKPTALGKEFLGTGAYHDYYQKKLKGPLANDSIKVSKSVTGPNKYVTERWKNRLSPHVILLLEYVFYDDLIKYNYKLIYLNKINKFKELLFIPVSLLPMTGEIPSFRWISDGAKISIFELANRLSYYIYVVPYYVSSRILLIKLYYSSFYKTNK